MGGILKSAFESLRYEWNEAPWFVLLVIGLTAFVGPGLIFGAWGAVLSWF